MAKTQQGAFPTTYHHIDAPTHQDDEWGREHKQRRLIIPTTLPEDCEYTEQVWREPIVGYLSNNLWHYKRKLDGENMRVQWDGEQALWNGKSDKFVCGAQLTEYMNVTFLEEIFEERFGRDKKVILFGEHMGEGVQGNELGLKGHHFVLYDVNINSIWLKPKDIVEVAVYFGIKTCYDYGHSPEMSEMNLCAIIKQVADGVFSGWEGVVATPVVECRGQKGERVICKIKNRDYYRESK